MGLYINESKHTEIYKNSQKIQEPNQGYFIRNHVSEMIQEQQRINNTLQRSFQRLKGMYEQQDMRNGIKMEEIGTQLKDIRDRNNHQQILEGQVTEQLKKLANDNQQLQQMIEEGKLSEQQIKEQLNQMDLSNELISKLLQEVTEANEQLGLKMDAQSSLQKQLSEQINVQSKAFDGVTERLDNQEALTEKIMRQIEHFRSTLFERTNYLSEKIEQSSAYILKLISGADQIQSNYMTQQKPRVKEKSSK